MPVNPQSPKKKAREAKKHIVNFSPSKEELTIEIDGKWIRYWNSDKVLELIEKAKNGTIESDIEIHTVCNACGLEDGAHTENCETNNAIQKENQSN